MNPNIEVSIEKLSAPVEVLHLDRRACSQLRRASIYTVAEVILAGRHRLKSGRSIGELTTNRVWSAAARYLGLEEETLAVGETLSEVLEDPISTLSLPISTLHALGSVGVFKIKGLLKARPNAYGTILGLGEQDILFIDRALRAHLAERVQFHLQIVAGQEQVVEPVTETAPATMDLDFLLQLLQIDERGWSMLEARAVKLISLREVGAVFGGVSSATVRRTLMLPHEGMRNKLSFFIPFLDHFEKQACSLWERIVDSDLDLKTLSLQLCPAPDSGLIAREQDVERMIHIMRTLVMHSQPWFSEEIECRWGRFICLSCLATPLVHSYEPVLRILQERRRKKRQRPYKELAYTVLAGEGKALHWTEIAERAERLGGRERFYAAHIPPSLCGNKDLFVRVAPGTYALREWDNSLGAEHEDRTH